MATKLYVGNLPYRITEEEISKHFGQAGQVHSVNIITDRETGRSRGFCFVEMDNAEEATAQLNDKELNGRKLRINPARERTSNGGEGRGFKKSY